MVRVLRQVFTVRRSLVGVRLHHRRFSGCPSVPPSVRPPGETGRASERERLRSCGQTDLTLLLKSMSSREGSGAKQGYMARADGRVPQGVIGDSRNLGAK